AGREQIGSKQPPFFPSVSPTGRRDFISDLYLIFRDLSLPLHISRLIVILQTQTDMETERIIATVLSVGSKDLINTLKQL
ncbi:MAG: hypothetical protein K2I11_03020, partial [Bacteroides sp.]|nr:hypothetical protein [Bacteroides sp.]